ncbi:MAG: hypothetical protein LBG80_12820 [Bacteroidales bacterium]|jgi:hypothetical protein|nr:hypothetical protein [Bacteroidales bacterium]
MNIPAYAISAKAIGFVARIAEKVGELKGSGLDSRDLRLRKINRPKNLNVEGENKGIKYNYFCGDKTIRQTILNWNRHEQI